MLKDLDNKIDTALKKLAESTDCISKSTDLENVDFSWENNIVNLLIERGLAERLKDTIYNIGDIELKIPTCKISTKGIDIVNKGGWLKHLELEKIKSERSEQKELYDYNISKWQSKTFWPVLIFGLFGGIYSGIDLYDKVSTKIVNHESKSFAKKHKSKLHESDRSILNQNYIDSLSKIKIKGTNSK